MLTMLLQLGASHVLEGRKHQTLKQLRRPRHLWEASVLLLQLLVSISPSATSLSSTQKRVVCIILKLMGRTIRLLMWQ